MTRFTEANVSHLMLDADRQPPSVKLQKYRNQPQVVDGIKFASKLEAKRYGELLLLEKAGKILGVNCQVRFPLIVMGHLVATYVADFTYLEGNTEVVEDCKGVKTPVYKLKRKLMKALYQIDIIEICA